MGYLCMLSAGLHSVLECVGHGQSLETAIGIARPGGAVGRVGVPQEETMPASLPAFFGNVKIGGGPAPARAYIEESSRTSSRARSSQARCSTAP